MDHDQLVQDLLNERSFSTEKSPVTDYFVDLRVGADAHGLPSTPVGQMRDMGARLAGYTEADAQAEAQRVADQILEEYGE